MECLNCQNNLDKFETKFCSRKCQLDWQYQEYISNWKLGLETGIVGKQTRDVSNHVRRYLNLKYEEKCCLCGWNQRNPVTNKIPLQVHHIDGNADNNTEDNLQLLCPNCHSLTETFGNLNKGQGRDWRYSPPL